MTTCPSCGSETADGVTCVVCGAEPAVAGEHHDSHGQFDPEGAAPVDSRDLVGATAADASTGASAGPTAAGTSDPHASEPGAMPPGSAAPPPPNPNPNPGAAMVWPAVPPPDPEAIVITEESRNWGMIAHLSALVAAGLGGLGFLGPLVVWLVRKDRDRYVAHHAVEALNFNLSIMLYAVLAVLLAFTIVLIPVSILMGLVGVPLWFIASIVAAVKAQRGEGFRYPLTIRLVKE